MRKLLAAAAVAAVATLGFAGHARAQEFYPRTPTSVPTRVRGTSGYPSQQYPTYPGQYSTPSERRPNRYDEVRRDRDHDNDDRGWRNASADRYDRKSNYGVGTSRGTRSVPSRADGYNTVSRPQSTRGDRDRHGQ